MSAPLDAPVRRWRPVAWVGPAMALVPGVIALVVTRSVLLWDGSYYAFRVANERGPAIFLHRWSAAVLQLPAVVAARAGASPGVVVLALGLIYSAVPLVAALMTWRVLVRAGRRDSFLWPMLGIAVVCLPGQLFVVSEAAIAAQLSWPLAAVVLTGRTRVQAVGGALLAVFICFLHPLAALSLLAIGGLAGWAWWRERSSWARSWCAGLAVLATIRLVIPLSAYERATSGSDQLAAHFHDAVAGRPLLALVLVYAGGLAMVLRGGPGRRRLQAVVVLATTVAAGAVLASSLGRPSTWAMALDYRSWVVPFTVPLFVILAMALRRPASPARVATWIAAGTFSVLLCLQGLAWWAQRRAYERRVAAAPAACTRLVDLPPPPGTALRHWATPALLLVDGEAHPRHLVLRGQGCARWEAGDGITISELRAAPEVAGSVELPAPAPRLGR